MNNSELIDCIIKMLNQIDDHKKLLRIFNYVHHLFL